MKKILFLIPLLIARIAAAQSANDLFENIDPYQKPAVKNPQQTAPVYPGSKPVYPSPQNKTAPQQVYQPPQYNIPSQQVVAPVYPGAQQQAPQQIYQPPQYKTPPPPNADALKVFGNGSGYQNSYSGQMQQQYGSEEGPAWQDPRTIDPAKEEKNYENRLKEGLEKPLPKRNITIGDDRIDELRSRVNALAVPKAKK